MAETAPRLVGMAQPPAETQLQMRYRYQADIGPAAGGAPIWTAAGRHPQGVALHDHDFLEIELVEAGTAEHRTIHGRAWVGEGTVSILHPGQWHAYDHARDLVLRDVYVDLRLFARELAWLREDPRLWPFMPWSMPRHDQDRRAAPQGVRTLHLEAPAFAQLRARCAALQRLGAQSGGRKRGLLIALALQIFELLADHPAIVRWAQDPVDPRIGTVLATVAADLRRPWSVADLARRAGMSMPHFTRGVRRATGRSPMQWLAHRRAERLAVLLLQDPRPIARLGADVGWDDPSYCARRFRACFGCSPDTYRRQGPPTGASSRSGR